MALENGYIKLHRKIIDWCWYKKPLTKHLFEHLLLIANIEDSKFENIIVRRGECVSSIRRLSADTGLTEKEVRTALKHLKKTQEVAQTVYPKFSVFTINNYDLYQAGAQAEASNGHMMGTQGASKGQHNKKDKNDKKNKEEKEIDNISVEFETLWKMYPRKVGKEAALRAYTKARSDKKDPTTFEQVKQGIENYIRQIEAKHTDTQYIKHGSSWFNSRAWKDDYDFSPAKQFTNSPQLVTINGKEYELRGGKYYVPGGCGIAVDPYAKSDLDDLF